MLWCSGLRKRYGDRLAVDGVSFFDRRRRVLRPARPERRRQDDHHLDALRAGAERRGRDHDRRPPRGARSRPRPSVGYVPQDLALYPDLTAAENLTFFGELYGLTGKELAGRIAETLELVGLADRAKDRIGTYSGGMKRRANMAAGLLHRPKLLVLDEPTVGVDPQSRNAILETVGRLGIAVLYTTHYMEEAAKLCDRIGIIDDGHLIAEGTGERAGAGPRRAGQGAAELRGRRRSRPDWPPPAGRSRRSTRSPNVEDRLELSTDHGPAVLPAVVALAGPARRRAHRASRCARRTSRTSS